MRAAARGAAKATAQWLTGGDGDGGIRTVDERQLHQSMGGGGEVSAGLLGWRRGRLRTTAVGDARGEAVGGGGVRTAELLERCSRPVPLRRGCMARAQCVAATRRGCADRRARRGKRRLTGGSLVPVISELKCTLRRK
jgi:hypothetical protein